MLSKERKMFLHDVFVTALEGGINYWADVYQYHWEKKGTDASEDYNDAMDLDGFFAVVSEEDEEEKYRINREVILTGINKILAVESVVRIHSSLRDTIETSFRDNDGGNIDAELADCIVQVGLFGEIVYG